jgi:hypothetical protein
MIVGLRLRIGCERSEWATRAIVSKPEGSGRWTSDTVLEPQRLPATPERVTIGR